MPDTQNVAAVVVTFNRKALLCECLDGLLAQTQPVRHILVIDNASTDGTGDFLAAKGYLANQKIQYVPLLTNTGGAGGFHEGMKRAYELDFDWLWLMDDDVEPVPDALERMIQCAPFSQCIQGSKIFFDGESEDWEKWANVSRSGRRTPAQEPATAPYIRVQTGCFEGMLVSREIVRAIGLPDTRFFIGGDDVAYGYLASHHTEVVFVREPCFVKKIKKGADPKPLRRLSARLRERRSSRFYFLRVRNELLLYSYLRGAVQAGWYSLRVAGLLARYSFVTLLLERSAGNFLALWNGARDGYHLMRSEPEVGL